MTITALDEPLHLAEQRMDARDRQPGWTWPEILIALTVCLAMLAIVAWLVGQCFFWE